MVRLVVESWDVAYGTGYEIDDRLPVPEVDLEVEQPAGGWSAVDPPDGAGASEVLFVDGVQRVDARITVIDGERSIAGLAGSFAAGAVRHAGSRAVVEQVSVRRGVFTQASDITLDCGKGVVYSPFAVTDTSPEALRNAMTAKMRALENVIATGTTAEFMVLDGPLAGDRPAVEAVGLVKTHWRRYLEADQDRLVARLGACQRTPVFLVHTKNHTRYSWYLRLPGAVAHPWSGIVRCEASGDLGKSEVLRLAGTSAATLPRFASSPHRDSRAPQNLTPIGELERQLRHRLGDAAVLERLLRRHCATWTS